MYIYIIDIYRETRYIWVICIGYIMYLYTYIFRETRDTRGRRIRIHQVEWIYNILYFICAIRTRDTRIYRIYQVGRIYIEGDPGYKDMSGRQYIYIHIYIFIYIYRYIYINSIRTAGPEDTREFKTDIAKNLNTIAKNSAISLIK